MPTRRQRGVGLCQTVYNPDVEKLPGRGDDHGVIETRTLLSP